MKYKMIATKCPDLGLEEPCFLFSIVHDTNPSGSFRITAETQAELLAKLRAMTKVVKEWNVTEVVAPSAGVKRREYVDSSSGSRRRRAYAKKVKP